jgi:hypothetical protein
MRQWLPALVVGLLALATGVPARANQAPGYTGVDCAWSANEGAIGTTQSGQQAYVYAGNHGSTGNGNTSAAGACVSVGGFGGYVEHGDKPGGTYTVFDGSNNNPAPADGYAGVSTYEDGSASPCSNGGTPGSTNSGGCLDVKPFGPVDPPPLPGPFACGNTSGKDWNSTVTDGCFLP